MPKKKTEEVEETIDAPAETETSEETAVEAKADDAQPVEETAEADESAAEKKPRKAAAKKTKEADAGGDSSIVETVLETVASAVETVTETVKSGASAVAAAVTGSDSTDTVQKGKRAEKIGVVASDKMTKTVTVRVDRLVKHPVYRKYIRKRKKFMAHDEMGSKIGDKVRIVETRPLSARKRWRVIEIIQKAER
ncbi:MAG: 30S ribosomal protein S17 [Blastocatellia bacterium]|nr:30S ribosomal protein S17 [Blastocatellia bacterium]